METEKKFVDGMSWFDPRQGAPEFVKGKISIEPKKLLAFLQANKEHMSPKGYFSVDVKESRGGSTYLELDTWKPASPSSWTEDRVGTNDRTPDPDKTYRSSIEGAVDYPTADSDLPF